MNVLRRVWRRVLAWFNGHIPSDEQLDTQELEAFRARVAAMRALKRKDA